MLHGEVAGQHASKVDFAVEPNQDLDLKKAKSDLRTAAGKAALKGRVAMLGTSGRVDLAIVFACRAAEWRAGAWDVDSKRG
jgi:hypothetical protein